jgi:predicted nuclease with TOPRIM domain
MNNKLDKILAEISAGELIDKITILEIKKTRISDAIKLKDVEKELSSLNSTFKNKIPDVSKIQTLINNLKSVNLKLWDIENEKRLAEKNKNFGKSFIELARNVYKNNDERAQIKLEINNILGSNIKEIKSHF